MIIDNNTAMIGIIGNPLGHSLSPRMHNQTLDKMGLNCIYLPFEVAPEKLGEAIAGLKALNIKGVNVTVPFKKAVLPYLDELSPEALACGAVNLIKNESGRLIGHNTDGRGFTASLADAGVHSLKYALLIGAGGAAQSVAYELTMSGVEHLDILDVDKSKAGELARFAEGLPGGEATGDQMSEELFQSLSRKADLIINCTPVGMYPDLEAAPVESLQNLKTGAVVYDLIYNPITTRFLSMARNRNLKTINGMAMLVHQGALTLQILTGFVPPIAFMKEVVSNNC